MFTVLTVLSVHGMMINGLRRVYKSASFILSTMGAICRQWGALPTVCKQLPCHTSPCAATQMGHWGAEVVFWTDCCLREGELKGRGRGQETFRYLSESRLILWKTAVLSHCQALCSTTQLVAVPAPLGKRCYVMLHWPMLPICLFLASKCAGAYKRSKDLLFSRELCFP